MDWEELAITELYQRFESIYRSVDKAVFPGLGSTSWPVLVDGIAYLTGGTDRFGSPIIYIPNNTKLTNYSETDFRGVIKYLVAATNASSADVGFVVVIDSRQSRWSSLAWLLQNVASCFPGELKMILALRPTNIFHGTLSAIAMRYQKDEYNYKIELVSCVENFWPWIARSDLPEGIGGDGFYDHPSWLKKRFMIENLAAILKRAIQRCKTYSVELISEQIVPDDICDQRLIEQDQECNRVMAEVDSLKNEGDKVVQDIIWQNVVHEKEAISTSLKDVQHLYSLILEVEDTFCDFWKKYEAKRAGYIQLKSFEKNYKKAASRISCLIEDLEQNGENEWMNNLGKGVKESPHLESDEGMTEFCLKAYADGEDLMRDHPYAIDCIKPKCEELKRLSYCFQNLLEEKIQNENLLRYISSIIQEVTEWSNAGMKLLSVQNLDNAKSPDGLQQALKELETFTSTGNALNIVELRGCLTEENNALDQVAKSVDEAVAQFDLVSELFEKRKAILKLHPIQENTRDGMRPLERLESQDKNSTSKQENTAIVYPMLQCDQNASSLEPESQHKLRQVINELVETERKYVEELGEIVQGYGHAIDDPIMAEFLPENLMENRNLLLGNLEEILLFHQTQLLPMMIECDADEVAIGNLFISKTVDFSLYYEYCHDSNKRKMFRKQIGENHAFFVECQRRLGHRLPLSAYLLKPVQRITKYQLLLQQMQKYSPSDEPGVMTRGVEAMMDVLKKLNDSMHEISITGFPEEFSTLGRLLLQGPFQIQMESKKGKVKDFARSKFNKVLRQLFLYENGLLICKKCQNSDTVENSSENGKTALKLKNNDILNSYQFRRCLKTSEISLTEMVKGSPRKLKLHSCDDDTELTITTPSNSIKQSWIKSLQDCVVKQKQIASSRSPSKVSSPRKNQEGATKAKVTSEPRRAKVQRSKSWGKNSTPSHPTSFLARQKSFAPGDKTTPKIITKRVKSNHADKGNERKSGEVTFGNIHGVDKCPTKSRARTLLREEKLHREVQQSTVHQPFRGKKKTKAGTK